MVSLTQKDLFFLILGAVVFLGLAVLLQTQVPLLKPFCEIDSSAYLKYALLFYKYGTFSPSHDPQVLPVYALGYSLFIGLLYKIFYPSPLVIVWVQCLISLMTGFFIFLIAKRLFSVTVARIAYFLFSVNLGFLVFSHFVLAEILLVFLLIVFFERFVVFLQTYQILPLFFSGLALGLSVPIKAAALYFPLLIFFFIAWHCRQSLINGHIKNVFFLLGFFIPVFGFMVHNKAVFNQFRITYLDSYNFNIYFYAQVLSYKHGTTFDQENAWLNKLDGSSESCIQKARKLCLTHLKKEPFLFLSVWLRNMSKSFFGLFTTNLKVLIDPEHRGNGVSFFKTKGSFFHRFITYVTMGTTYSWIKIIGWLEIAWSLMRYVFCCIAIAYLLQRRRYLILWWFGLYVSYFAVITGLEGSARYRMFFEFVLIILAALGISVVWQWFKHKKVVV